MKYTVTRQLQWPDGNQVVEVSVGSFDYCNPGVMVKRYPGEMEEFSLAEDAANAALNIQRLWQQDCPDQKIEVGYGYTAGMTIPFDACESEDLIEWARNRDKKLPCCIQCGERITEKPITIFSYSDLEFCREYCAEEWINTMEQCSDSDDESSWEDFENRVLENDLGQLTQ